MTAVVFERNKSKMTVAKIYDEGNVDCWQIQHSTGKKIIEET